MSSNFIPSGDILMEWTWTRKSTMLIGKNFYHPRILSTVEYSRDNGLFWFAMGIESLTLIVAIVLTGLNFIFIGGAIVLILLDLYFAGKLHNKQNEISKLNCEIQLRKYEQIEKLSDASWCSDQQKAHKASINIYKSRRIPFIILIFLLATIKVVGAFLAFAPYSIVIAVAVPILFYICAAIHVYNTGFRNAEWNRLRRQKKEEAKFLAKVATKDEKQKQYNGHLLENVPNALLEELKKAFVFLTDREKELRKVIDKEGHEYIIIFGSGSEHKVAYRVVEDKFYLLELEVFLDESLFEFINSSKMSSPLKSFIGYQGLQVQMQTISQGKSVVE